MSQRARAYQGIGLVLDYKEFAKFAEMYDIVNVKNDHDPSMTGADVYGFTIEGVTTDPSMAEADENGELREHHWVSSEIADKAMEENPEGAEYYFDICDLADMVVWPELRRIGGRYVNTWHEYEDECYVIFADHPQFVFADTFYQSYEDLRSEFVRKLSKYLPNDFDYDAHIGEIRYVAYA